MSNPHVLSVGQWCTPFFSLPDYRSHPSGSCPHSARLSSPLILLTVWHAGILQGSALGSLRGRAPLFAPSVGFPVYRGHRHFVSTFPLSLSRGLLVFPHAIGGTQDYTRALFAPLALRALRVLGV